MQTSYFCYYFNSYFFLLYWLYFLLLYWLIFLLYMYYCFLEISLYSWNSWIGLLCLWLFFCHLHFIFIIFLAFCEDYWVDLIHWFSCLKYPVASLLLLNFLYTNICVFFFFTLTRIFLDYRLCLLHKYHTL